MKDRSTTVFAIIPHFVHEISGLPILRVTVVGYKSCSICIPPSRMYDNFAASHLNNTHWILLANFSSQQIHTDAAVMVCPGVASQKRPSCV